MDAGYLLHHRYRIERRLKQGGMGSLFLARDQTLGSSLCVVKQMIDVAGEEPGESLRRFEAEMLALVRLKHPRIPRVRDYFHEVDGYFLVMDYVEGVSLEEDRGPIEVGQVVAEALDVLEVLVYLHQQQPPILHRDIKPANLIRDESTGRIVVVDFGLAREWSASSRHSSVGTLGYSSLEQIQGHTQPASDIYSLGVTLIERLTGKTPVFAQSPEVPDHLDSQLRQILGKAVNADLSLRYNEASRMLADLQNWQSPILTESTPPQSEDPIRSTPRPHQGHKLGHWLVALLMLLALAVLGILFPLLVPSQTTSHSTDPGLPGDLFGNQKLDDHYAITLGENIGLMRILPWGTKDSKERSEEVSQRLNRLYHEQCPVPNCRQFKLEPAGIQVGHFREQQVDEVVVFYAHRHAGVATGKPFLIATVDLPLAQKLGSSRNHVAAFWRDLLRDTVALSRGQSSTTTALSKELSGPIEKARKDLKPGQKGNDLGQILNHLESAQALRLQTSLLKPPADFTYLRDEFRPSHNYYPLEH